jgi:predicted adenine nucleotide alpha hydrolase (AANH) superfamily ATPase
MFEDDKEKDERCEHSLDLFLWLQKTAAAAMSSTPDPAP